MPLRGRPMVVMAMAVMWISRCCPAADEARLRDVTPSSRKRSSSTKRQDGGDAETQHVCQMWEHARLKLRHSNSSVSTSPIILPFPANSPTPEAGAGAAGEATKVGIQERTQENMQRRRRRRQQVAIETVEGGEEGEDEEWESGKLLVQVGDCKESPTMRKRWEETMHRNMAIPNLVMPARRNGCRYLGGCNMSGARKYICYEFTPYVHVCICKCVFEDSISL